MAEGGTPYFIRATCFDIDSLNVNLFDLDISCVDSCGIFASLDTTICEGDSFQGISYTESIVLEKMLDVENGLDSFLLCNITVLDSSLIVIDSTICNTDSVFIGNMPFFEQGNYIIPLSDMNGCDSTIILELEVLGDTIVIDTSICSDEFIFINNIPQNQAGIYFESLSLIHI